MRHAFPSVVQTKTPRYASATLRLSASRGGRILRTIDLSGMPEAKAIQAVRRLRRRADKLDAQYGAIGHTVDVTFA